MKKAFLLSITLASLCLFSCNKADNLHHLLSQKDGSWNISYYARTLVPQTGIDSVIQSAHDIGSFHFQNGDAGYDYNIDAATYHFRGVDYILDQKGDRLKLLDSTGNGPVYNLLRENAHSITLSNYSTINSDIAVVREEWHLNRP